MENGELLLITVLMNKMLMWCADSLDMTLDVRLCIMNVHVHVCMNHSTIIIRWVC